jgi:hypothetical protein
MEIAAAILFLAFIGIGSYYVMSKRGDRPTPTSGGSGRIDTPIDGEEDIDDPSQPTKPDDLPKL